MKKLIAAAALSFALLHGTAAQAQDATMVEAAKKEGKLIIYAPFDEHELRPVFDAFRQKYGNIAVEYNDLSTPVIFNRFMSEVASGSNTADFLWSSAVDLQVKLANDGHAVQYRSPETGNINPANTWDGKVYTVMNEPMCWIYNKKLLPEDKVPRDHAGLAKLLNDNPDTFKGKVSSYDIEKTGVGFFSVALDNKRMENFFEIPKAFGAANARFLGSSGAMVESVASGESVFGYNLTCSVPAFQAQKNPNLGIVYPSDFTNVVGRVALIPNKARNQNAAKLFLDFLLSKDGQSLMAATPGLYPAHKDVPVKGLDAEMIKTSFKPVELGPDLLFNLDPKERLAFLSRWKSSIASGRR